MLDTAHSYGDIFERCPESLAIVEGDVIVACNAAFRARVGNISTLSAWLHVDDHGALAKARAAGETCSFTARPALGDDKGVAMRWTIWPIENPRICVRLDGLAQRSTEVPAPLAPLFEGEASPSLTTRLAGKMFERIDGALWAIAKDGTILLSEGAALARYKLKPGQVVGLNARQIYPAGSRALTDVEIVIDRGTPRHDAHIENTEYWVRAVEPVRDASGDVTALVGFSWCAAVTSRDITEAQALLGAIQELPLAIWAVEPDGTCSLSVGKGLYELGTEPGEMVGANLLDTYASNPEFLGHLNRALAGERVLSQAKFGGMIWQNHYVPVRDALGDKVRRVYAVCENVTTRLENERRLAEQLALIQSQQQAITNLSSPIIEVWQGVLVVPVIGNLDENRASHLLEHLLTAVVARQSQSVILDLTGVDVANAATAQHLYNVMRSVELLGATGLVSGIRPSVAKTMVELEISLTSWRTFPTLAEALRRLIGARKRPR